MRTLSIGMIVCATRSEATIAITIGIATCFIRIVISLGEPNTSGTNTMIVASVPASVATPTSLTPRSVAPRGSPGVELAVPEHALGDHDGVVHQHADRQHHAHHREDVERQAEEVQRGERDQQRARHGERDDRGHRPVAQEEEQHGDREHQADQAGVAQLAERVADALGLVADHDDADALQLRQRLGALDLLERGVDDFDDVRLRRLEHVQAHRRAVVEVPADLQLRRDAARRRRYRRGAPRR